MSGKAATSATRRAPKSGEAGEASKDDDAPLLAEYGAVGGKGGGGDDEVRDQKSVRMTGMKQYCTVGLLCILTAFLFADQNIMAPNLTQIADDFGFNAQERDQKLGGDISMAFFVLGGPVSLLVGWLTDKIPRKMLFCGLILLGEGPALMTIFVTQFWELLVLRALTGIAIGGAMPLVFSFLGDIYTTKERANVSALISVSIGVGITAGQLIAGLVGPTLGWRMPFVIVALPAITITFISMCVIEEPERGCTEDGLHDRFDDKGGYQYKERITAGKAAGIFLIPTNVLTFFQGLPGCLPWSVIIIFMNDFLTQEKGLSVEHSTFVLTALNIGGCFGALAGGLWGQMLYNWYRPSITYLMGGSTLVAIVPTLWLLHVDKPAPSMWIMCSVAFVGGFIGYITGPNVRAVLLNVNAPETRGTTFAIYNLMDHLGTGVGPLIIVMIMSVVGQSRILAFDICIVAGWAICGGTWLGMGFVLTRDEDRLQKRLESGDGPETCCFP